VISYLMMMQGSGHEDGDHLTSAELVVSCIADHSSIARSLRIHGSIFRGAGDCSMEAARIMFNDMIGDACKL